MNHLSSQPRVALFAGMGLGKTVITETFLDILHNVWGEDGRTLVLAPLRVAKSVWPEEAKKWKHLSGLGVVSATGTQAEREIALRRDEPVVCTNYDNLTWLRDYYRKSGRAWPFTTVVADESTRLKSFRLRQGGVRAQALSEFAHVDVKRWINLTGTPAPNGLVDLWGQTWFLDAGERLGRTFTSFQDRWFGWKRKSSAATDKYGIDKVIFPFAQEQIQERIKDLCLTIDPKDWFDLRAPIVNVISVDLPPSAKAKYKELEKEMFVRFGEHEIEAFNAAALTMKCLQLANGAMYLDPDKHEAGAAVDVHDAKLEALESIITEAAGAPVLVAYHFKSDLRRILARFPQARHLDKKPKTIDDWNAGRIPVLVAHPASAGHGLNLQDGGNILAFFGHWWDLEQHDQMVERIGPVRQLQSGHDRAVFLHYIVARGTVDELVVARRESKRTVQDTLLNYMKGKP